MTFTSKSLACDPSGLKGLSERLIVSHYENNDVGAISANMFTEQPAELDPATAQVCDINGLKREQLIVMNSMILYDLYVACPPCSRTTTRCSATA